MLARKRLQPWREKFCLSVELESRDAWSTESKAHVRGLQTTVRDRPEAQGLLQPQVQRRRTAPAKSPADEGEPQGSQVPRRRERAAPTRRAQRLLAVSAPAAKRRRNRRIRRLALLVGLGLALAALYEGL